MLSLGPTIVHHKLKRKGLSESGVKFSQAQGHLSTQLLFIYVKFISLREEPVIGLDDGHLKVKDSQKKVKIPKVF